MRPVVSLPEPVATALSSWLAAHDVAVPGVIEGLYVVGSVALDDWTPRSDIDIVAVVADPSDPDLADGLADAQVLVRERVGLSIDGPYVAWGDLVAPAMAVQRPWVLDGEYRVDGESFEINPVTWYTLATYGIAVRGVAPARIGVAGDAEEHRSWVAENLDTYWRGVGEVLVAGVTESAEEEWGGCDERLGRGVARNLIARGCQPCRRATVAANSAMVSSMIFATGSTDSMRPATWPDRAMAAFMSPPK